MYKSHETFLRPFFESMNEVFPGSWCVLHSYQTLPEYSVSDVDMAFSLCDVAKLESVLIDVAENTGWKILQKLWYDIPECYYYVLKNNSNVYLAIDFLIDRKGLGRYGFSTSILTRDLMTYNELIPIPSHEVSFCYKTVKLVIKKKSFSKDRDYLEYHFKRSNVDVIKELLLEHIDNESTELIINRIKNNIEINRGELETLNQKKKTFDQKRLKFFKGIFFQIKRLWDRVRHPRGMVIFLPLNDRSKLKTFKEDIEQKVDILFRKTEIVNKYNVIAMLRGFISSTLVISTKRKSSCRILNTWKDILFINRADLDKPGDESVSYKNSYNTIVKNLETKRNASS